MSERISGLQNLIRGPNGSNTRHLIITVSFKAKVVGISEDYAGQYFKILTGINPLDYIVSQRMEKAVVLLNTMKKSIQDIKKTRVKRYGLFLRATQNDV